MAKNNDLESVLDTIQENQTATNENVIEENKIKNQPKDRFMANTKVRILDKITGKSITITELIGNNHRERELEFQFLKCWKSYPDELPENKLLLKIINTTTKETLFFGWIFSSSPSLNSFNNRDYDITLLNCGN